MSPYDGATTKSLCMHIDQPRVSYDATSQVPGLGMYPMMLHGRPTMSSKTEERGLEYLYPLYECP